MKKPALMQILRNILIGSILLLIAAYLFYLAVNLVAFSLDRTSILEDANQFGWHKDLVNWYQLTVANENAFIANSVVCQIVTAVPMFGKVVFTAVSIFLLWFSFSIIYFNGKHLLRIQK